MKTDSPAFPLRTCLAAVAFLAAAPPAHALAELGPGALFLDVRAGLTYDSNIFTNAAKVDDFIASLSPTLVYQQDRGLIHLVATVGTTFKEYFDYDAQSGTDLYFDFDLSGMHREPAPAMNFALTGSYADASTASEEIATRIDIETYSLQGSLDFQGSEKTGFRLSGGFSERDYEDGAFSDSQDYNLRADLLYKYSEKLRYKIGYRYRDIDHPVRSYDSDTFIIGAEGTLSPKLAGSVEAGVNETEDEKNDKFYYSVGLGWEADQNTSFSLSGKRDYTPSALGVSAISTNLMLSVDQRFTDSLSGSGYIGFGRFSRSGTERRNDKTAQAGASLSLRVGERSAVTVSADYEKRDSSSPDSDYDRVLLSIGASTRF